MVETSSWQPALFRCRLHLCQPWLRSSPSAFKAVSFEEYKACLQRKAEQKRQEADEHNRKKKAAMAEVQWHERELATLFKKEMACKEKAIFRIISSKPGFSGTKSQRLHHHLRRVVALSAKKNLMLLLPPKHIRSALRASASLVTIATRVEQVSKTHLF